MEEIASIELKDNIDGQFAKRSLKIHFLGGLKNSSLKQLAKTQRDKNFVDLVNYLDEEYKECEQIEDIERRLQAFKTSKFQKKPNFSSNQNPSRWNETHSNNTNWIRNRNYIPNQINPQSNWNTENQRLTHPPTHNHYTRKAQFQNNYNRNHDNNMQRTEMNQYHRNNQQQTTPNQQRNYQNPLQPRVESRNYSERTNQRNFQHQNFETITNQPNYRQNQRQQVQRYQNQTNQQPEHNNRYNNNKNQHIRYSKNE